MNNVAIPTPKIPITIIPIKNKIINAGIDAIAHLTINLTIEPNGILISSIVTGWNCVELPLCVDTSIVFYSFFFLVEVVLVFGVEDDLRPADKSELQSGHKFKFFFTSS